MNRQLNVYLYGRKTGVLTEDQLGHLSFQYEADAQFPLSARMPVRPEEYDRFYTEPFFDNLTPEGEALQVVAQKFHVSQDNIFSILDKIGGDCAGAVSLYAGDFPVNTDSPLYNIDEEDIARVIDELPDNPLLTGMENAPRLSLAGAQSKFAVCKIDGKYYRSDDDFPTTHIIKITNKRFPHLLENELFCMKLAKEILGTVGVELREANSRPYLEIERYDRQIKEGNIFRIHQEDFCQVLGVPARRKYQQDGGPKIRDCYNAIIEFSSQAPADANKFVELLVFNYLIGNTDAHAKNFSILHRKGEIVLSPAYDLLSAEIYPEKDISREIAMTINGKGKYDAIGKKDFLALYEQLGQNPTNMARLVKNKFANIILTAESVRSALNNDSQAKSGVYDSIIEIIRRRMASLFEE
ncbi:MAG: type II toxin-antitoxin system HipA family toxin [Treponema sp.]|jgi:serine/threonine-protein kinase HipA|nr:type II toxin-antitoxin system HipA family toxin [Treponema sp.]